jgi:hypothetical protein
MWRAWLLVSLLLQVSAFGSDSQTDGGDVWAVEWDTKSKHWKQDAKVRATASMALHITA